MSLDGFGGWGLGVGYGSLREQVFFCARHLICSPPPPLPGSGNSSCIDEQCKKKYIRIISLLHHRGRAGVHFFFFIRNLPERKKKQYSKNGMREKIKKGGPAPTANKKRRKNN